MTTKSQRLELVAQLAARKEQAAMDELQRSRQYLDQQTAQLDSLKQYHRQYIDELKQQLQGQVDMQKIQSYQQFTRQVEGAIEQQNNVVANAQQQFDHKKADWLVFRDKSRALQELVEKYRNQERIAAEKMEEKRMQDDFTGRRFSSKR